MTPVKSPDLNIIEDVWKLMSVYVYEPQFKNIGKLIEKLTDVVHQIKTNKKQLLIN